MDDKLAGEAAKLASQAQELATNIKGVAQQILDLSAQGTLAVPDGHMPFVALLTIFALACFVAAALYGQSFYGSVVGAITDQSGAAVRGASVALTNTGTGVRSQAQAGANGEYLFRTIKPVPYPGRTPHIHYKVKRGGKELLTTQLFIKGHPGNERDGIWRGVKDEKARRTLAK